ncbi:MAG: bifunctional NADH-specific enoyl-ACP reductase/trans-2-enoyl-CoA reductase [Candidatus Melainabacteria bacterium]|nr:MAG: bifunctional NADH-specific enoyl-ACP reductase/trans-2-enoyl-CoA reductase [Candidatus Melainabacteria bacterium]
MVIKPKIRGFICTTTHPTGCAAHVHEQIAYVKAQPPIERAPQKVLVIGSSTGYGLSSRIVAAFGGKADTIGVYFDKQPENGKTGTAGFYNTFGFEKAAHAQGLTAKSINGDAFSDDVKQRTIELIKKELGKVDLVVYSVASPVRTHPKTGTTHRSTLKPIGASFSAKTLDTDKDIVKEVSIEPASKEEIADTVAVMGGEDWMMWMEALKNAGVLAPGIKTVSYSYIGPKVTWPVYRDGTIGRAKKDLEESAKKIQALLKPLDGRAYVSVNKALVTQASSAIPVVPLYISLLYKVMKQKGNHEGCIEQIHRLFATQLYSGKEPTLDAEGRIRIDDREMDPDVQAKVEKLWHEVNSENIKAISDIESYKSEFLKLFGFGLSGIDYEAPVSPEI